MNYTAPEQKVKGVSHLTQTDKQANYVYPINKLILTHYLRSKISFRDGKVNRTRLLGPGSGAGIVEGGAGVVEGGAGVVLLFLSIGVTF